MRMEKDGFEFEGDSNEIADVIEAFEDVHKNLMEHLEYQRNLIQKLEEKIKELEADKKG